VPRLMVMRHAKSDWGAAGVSDHDRPLAARGVAAAQRMGRFLTAVGVGPDRVLSSPAVRARATVELAAEAGGWSAPIEIVERFYGGDWRDVVEGIAVSASGASKLLVAGHEPTWSDLVSMLTGGGGVRMPTGAVACVDLGECGWSDIGPGIGELRWLVTPRLLKPLL